MSAYAMPESFFQTAPPRPSVKVLKASNPAINVPSPSLSPPIGERKMFTSTVREVEKVKCDPSVCAGGELGVTVHSARIDHARLIKAVSKRPSAGSVRSKNSQYNVETTYVTNDDDDETDSYFCRKVSNNSTQSAPSNKDSENNYEEAIQFELSISFNGRKYTATRALPRFVKLRSELIEEMTKAARLARRRTTMRNRRRYMAPSKKIDEMDHKNRSDSDTDVDTDSDDSREESSPSVAIPALPIDQKDGSGTIFGGCGFTMLHATLKEYCPAMERWLRHVADIVPPNSSPSLTNFLWEPLGSEDTTSCDVSSGNRHLRRQGTLNSINETQGSEDDGDDDLDSCSWTSDEI